LWYLVLEYQLVYRRYRRYLEPVSPLLLAFSPNLHSRGTQV
jgi:hypothetical protein